MLTVRVIPCLDVRDGRVVKGVRFSGLRDAGSPAELAAAYEAQGADEIVLLDVSATTEGRGTQLETVRSVRARLSIPLTVGGGVRAVDDAGALLDAGADKVSVNTAAVADPSLVDGIAARFGSQCAVVAIDAASRGEGERSRDPSASGKRSAQRGEAERRWVARASPGRDPSASRSEGKRSAQRGEAERRWVARASPGRDPSDWEVVVRSGKQRTGIDAIAWAEEVVRRGAGELLLTSFDRDGTRSGYDLELLSRVSSAVGVPVIASGGADSAAHMLEALRAGADAVLAASIFHDGDETVAEVKAALAEGGVEVRR